MTDTEALAWITKAAARADVLIHSTSRGIALRVMTSKHHPTPKALIGQEWGVERMSITECVRGLQSHGNLRDLLEGRV